MVDSVKVREGMSSSIKSLGPGKIIIIIILFLMILALILKFAGGVVSSKSSSDDKKSGDVEVIKPPPINKLAAGPDVEADPAMVEDIKTKHEKTVEEDSGFRKSTVLPPMGGVGVDEKISGLEAELTALGVDVAAFEPEPKPKMTKPVVVSKSNNKKEKTKKKEDVNPYTPRIEKLYAKWGKANQSNGTGINLSIPMDLYDGEPNVEPSAEEKYNNFMKENGVDFLKVHPATLELGYNSDMGGLMIVSVNHPGLKGVRFLAETTVGAYNKRAAITLTKGLSPDGSVFQVDGVVVDQNDRVPSVTGKVKRHFLYNTVFGFGTSLLEGFAKYSELDAGLVRGTSLFPNINGNVPEIDSDGLIVAQGASALASSIKAQGSFRPNTLTTKPWKTVGVVFLPK